MNRVLLKVYDNRPIFFLGPDCKRPCRNAVRVPDREHPIEWREPPRPIMSVFRRTSHRPRRGISSTIVESNGATGEERFGLHSISSERCAISDAICFCLRERCAISNAICFCLRERCATSNAICFCLWERCAISGEVKFSIARNGPQNRIGGSRVAAQTLADSPQERKSAFEDCHFARDEIQPTCRISPEAKSIAEREERIEYGESTSSGSSLKRSHFGSQRVAAVFSVFQ
jgi:hypothetical protein